MAQHFFYVTGEAGDSVVALFRPIRLPVAAEVDGDRLPPTFGHRRGGRAPRAAGLAPAVQEHRRRRLRVAKPVSHDAYAAGAVGAERLGCRSHRAVLTPCRLLRSPGAMSVFLGLSGIFGDG